MPGMIYRYLAQDHDRLDDLLNRAVVDPENGNMDLYAQFRSGLLRHISMEEKVLLPAATRLQGGGPLPIADRIRLDHGAITSLMVPPPDAMIISTLRSILQVHNALEEQEGGMYMTCEQLSQAEEDHLLAQLKEVPAVPVLPHNPRPEAREAVKRAVARAGYTMKE